MRSRFKGYGETHERGQAKFDKLVVVVPRLLGRGNSGATLEALIKAALEDEDGQALDKAIAELGFTTSDRAANSAHSRESGNPGSNLGPRNGVRATRASRGAPRGDERKRVS